MDASSPEGGPRSWSARVLAPVALVVTAAAALLIVVGTIGGGDETDETDEPAETAECNPKADAAVENGFYLIKPGENLSTVVDRTCMEIEEITELNPELDPQLLPVGACVNLQPDGCEAAGSPDLTTTDEVLPPT